MNIATAVSDRDTLSMTPREARRLFRAGDYAGYTSGYCRGYIQGSLCILPQRHALDFASYCQRNPKPCPLLAVGSPGDPFLPALGEDLDIRTDVPRYRVMRDGEIVEQPTDIRHLWRDDLVAFVWGCSFSFEQALLEAGITLRECAQGDRVVMYETNIDTHPVGVFRGRTIVTMRPLVPAEAIRAIQVTARFPNAHGAPIHIGLPEMIGIEDLEKPMFRGRPPQMQPHELPVFWACGVTPQLAVMRGNLPFCILHKPGSMVIADRLNSSYSVS